MFDYYDNDAFLLFWWFDWFVVLFCCVGCLLYCGCLLWLLRFVCWFCVWMADLVVSWFGCVDLDLLDFGFACYLICFVYCIGLFGVCG